MTIGYENDTNLPDPSDVIISMQLGSNGAMVDVSQYVPIESVSITVPGNGKIGTLQFDIVAPANQIGGVTYTIDDNVEVRVEEISNPTDTDPRYRHFQGWTTEVASETVGNDKIYHVTAQTPGLVLTRPAEQITTAWPSEAGLPVIDTGFINTVTAGVRSLGVRDIYDFYVGRKFYVSNVNGSNRERVTAAAVTLAVDTTAAAAVTTVGEQVTVTPADITGITNGMRLTVYNADAGNTNREVVIAGDVGNPAGTFKATFLLTKDANYVIRNGTVDVTLTLSKVSSGTTVAAALTSTGEQEVTPASMTNIAVGYLLDVHNSNGTNAEQVIVTAVTGTTFTASFQSTKTAAWVVRVPALAYGGLSDKDVLDDGFYVGATQYIPFFDEYFNKAKYTTVALDASAGNNVVVTPASMVDIFPNHSLIVADEDGSNEEVLVVDGVDYAAGTFTIRTLVGSRTGPWRVYNNVYVLKDAISEVITSLPGLVAQAQTPLSYLEAIQQNGTMTNTVSTTSSTVVAPGSVAVTPASMVGIYSGQRLICYNADNTNRETVTVTGTTATTFTAVFVYAKTGTWRVEDTPDVVDFAMTWNQDNAAHTNPWDLRILWYNPFDVTTLATLALTDAATITPGTNARYVDPYSRTVDGSRRGYKATVLGANGAVGTYTDPVVPRGKRLIELEPITDETLTTNDACTLRAKQIVRSFKYPAETVTVNTYARVDTALFYEATSLTWGHEHEGGTPARYAIANKSLTFPGGAPYYSFTLGQAWEEIGDKPQPRFGAVNLRDVVAPAAPTWASGTGWLLSNLYNSATGYADIHIQWNSSREADLNHFRVYLRETGAIAWNVLPLVDYPTHEIEFPVLPGTDYDVSVKAVDNSGNMSGRSDVKSFTSQAVQNPDPPTSLTVTRNYYNGRDRMAHLILEWTNGGSAGVEYTEFFVNQGGILNWHHVVPASATRTEIVMLPGVSYSIYAQHVAAHNHRSSNSNTVSGTTANQNIETILYNSDFQYESPTDETQPDGWTITQTGSTITTAQRATGAFDISGPYYYAIAMSAHGVSTSQIELLSDPVAVTAGGGTIDSGRIGELGAFVYRATANVGTITGQIWWYSTAGGVTPISTSNIFVGAPGATLNNNILKYAKFSVPNAASTARLYLKYDNDTGVGGGGAISIYFGACQLEDTITDLKINNEINLDSNEAFTFGSGSALNTESGAGMALTHDDTTPIEFLESGSLRAQMYYYAALTALIIEGVATGGVDVGVRVKDSIGQEVYVRPTEGVQVVTATGKKFTANAHRIANEYNTVCFNNGVVCFNNQIVIFGDD